MIFDLLLEFLSEVRMGLSRVVACSMGNGICL